MTTSPLTLADFLLARIAVDEAMANRLRSGHIGDPWGWQPFNYQLEWCDKRRIDYPPARVLGECEAKRDIVKQYLEAEHFRDMYGPESGPACGILQPVLRALALPYADHPDYRPEWQTQAGTSSVDVSA